MESFSDREEFHLIQQQYDKYFRQMMDGNFGKTAAYWALYIYLINRLCRELQKAVRHNDVEHYIEILPNIVEVFFALNRSNYARWGCLYLQNLQNLSPDALNTLKAGAFSTRRKKKK